MNKKLLVFALLLILILSMLISGCVEDHIQKNSGKTLTNFEGVLRAPCGGIGDLLHYCQSNPSIEYQNKKCEMNLYLETDNSKELWDDQNNIRTSFCFFESKFNEKEFETKFLDKKVTITGSMENATVCELLRKCLEPECVGCNKEQILLPVEIKLG